MATIGANVESILLEGGVSSQPWTGRSRSLQKSESVMMLGVVEWPP